MFQSIGVRSDASEKIKRLIESGPFEAHVAHTFPFDKAADAQRALDKHYLSKLTLRLPFVPDANRV